VRRKFGLNSQMHGVRTAMLKAITVSVGKKSSLKGGLFSRPGENLKSRGAGGFRRGRGHFRTRKIL